MMLKTDGQEDLVWQEYLEMGTNNSNEAHSIQQTNDGEYVIVSYIGRSTVSSYSRDVHVAKLLPEQSRSIRGDGIVDIGDAVSISGNSIRRRKQARLLRFSRC